jgi:hypothetical protein
MASAAALGTQAAPLLAQPSLLRVRESAALVLGEAQHVRVETGAPLRELANELLQARGARPYVPWRACDCHFLEPVQQQHWKPQQEDREVEGSVARGAATRAASGAAWGELQARFVLVLDTLNFCFWPGSDLCKQSTELAWLLESGALQPIEYAHLAGCLKDVAEQRPAELSPAWLAQCVAADVRRWFAQRWSGECEWPAGAQPCPMPAWQEEERARLLRELGDCLLRHGGSALALLERAGRSAPRLAQLLADELPGFRDTCIWRGRQVCFYKRAQIAVADLWGAFDHGALLPALAFNDIDQLTMFPDYRVPQLLRACGVLAYSQELARRVDSHELLPAGGEEECELRAASVQACALLRAELELLGGLKWTDVEVDWTLWQAGEKRLNDLKPHHRTLTIFY